MSSKINLHGWQVWALCSPNIAGKSEVCLIAGKSEVGLASQKEGCAVTERYAAKLGRSRSPTTSSPSVVRRVSAHARLRTHFFLSEIISIFLHIFTHSASRYGPIDLAGERTTPFDGMRCNLG